MRVAVAGSSGFIGTALCESLAADGHAVLRLVRRPTTAPGELRWDPAIGDLDPNPLEGLDAVVNLAGAGVGDHRWTKAYKETLRSSRVHTTSVLATALARLDSPPRVFVCASGMNVYGDDRGSEVLDEYSSPGESFLAALCRDWEAAAQPAKVADVAVCYARFGIVVGAQGGALAQMFPVFRFGVGGPLAGGRQYWSYISLTDAVRALRFILEQPGSVGAYNITGPEPVTNAEFTRVLAHGMHRPAILPVPKFALRIGLGQIADTLAGSLRVVPRRLLDAGFRHEHPDARSVVTAALGQ